MAVTVLGVQHRVALRKESVDRNKIGENLIDRKRRSLSARRAWIEIERVWITLGLPVLSGHLWSMSLSARRAWIEMQISVTTVVGVLGRSPQGERG